MFEFDNNKLYYSISEVAKHYDVNTSLIRFWEKEFDGFLNLKKNNKGNRFFTKENLTIFDLIYTLIKEKGYTIEGAKKKLKDEQKGTLDKEEIIKSLKEIREFLIELKKEI